MIGKRVARGRHRNLVLNSVGSVIFNSKGHKRVGAVRQRHSGTVLNFNGRFQGVKVCVTVKV